MFNHTATARPLTIFAFIVFFSLSCANTVQLPAADPAGFPCRFDETVPLDGTPSGQKIDTVPGKIVAVGDLHGDIGALIEVLTKAKLIDGRLRWSGGDAILVQTGDILDRGNDEVALLAFLERLKAEAQAAGGRIYALNGNHELMNVEGNFSYTSAAGISSFLQTGLPRAAAFAPGGQCARYLARGPVALDLAGNIFVHGGVLPEHAQEGLPLINEHFSAWMRGGTGAFPPTDTEKTLLWTRQYSSTLDCATLRQALAALGAKRMIVGHTVQPHINAACDGTLYRIDTGMSKYYMNGPREALLIENDRVTFIQ